jgi:hypothetical protein
LVVLTAGLVPLGAAGPASSRADVRTAAVEAAPYGLDQRPAPDGFVPDALLPGAVGPFVRSALPEGTLNQHEDVTVSYSDARGRVDVGFSMNESSAMAQQAVRSARAYAVQLARSGAHPPCQESIGGDPSFVKAHDYIAWSRGRFFFYAKATDGATLDRFMSAFPY